MNYNEFEKFYESCKNMSNDDLSKLLETAKTKEEQNFYVTVSDFFLQQRQREVIAKGIF